MNDEPLRRGADVREGIAGHEGERTDCGRVQHGHVVWLDHARGADDVYGRGTRSRDRDAIACTGIPQPAEERVPMAGEAAITRRARKGSRRNVPDRSAQRGCVVAFADDCRHAEALNVNAADRSYAVFPLSRHAAIEPREGKEKGEERREFQNTKDLLSLFSFLLFCLLRFGRSVTVAVVD